VVASIFSEGFTDGMTNFCLGELAGCPAIDQRHRLLMPPIHGVPADLISWGNLKHLRNAGQWLKQKNACANRKRSCPGKLPLTAFTSAKWLFLKKP